MNDAQITFSIIGLSYWILIIYWLLEARFNPLSSYETFIVSGYRVSRYNLRRKVFYYFKLTCLIIAPVFTCSVISYYNLKFFYSFGANPDQILAVSFLMGIAVALIISPLFLRSVKQPINLKLQKLSELLYKNIHEVFWNKSNASESLSKAKIRYKEMIEDYNSFIESYPEFSEGLYKSDVVILLNEIIQYIDNLKSFSAIHELKDLEHENSTLNEKLEKTEKKLEIQRQEVKRNTELADLYKQRGSFNQIKTFSQIPSDSVAYIDEGIIQSEYKPYIPFVESAKHRNPNLYNCVADLQTAILSDFIGINSIDTAETDQSIRSILQLIQYHVITIFNFKNVEFDNQQNNFSLGKPIHRYYFPFTENEAQTAVSGRYIKEGSIGTPNNYNPAGFSIKKSGNDICCSISGYRKTIENKRDNERSGATFNGESWVTLHIRFEINGDRLTYMSYDTEIVDLGTKIGALVSF